MKKGNLELFDKEGTDGVEHRKNHHAYIGKDGQPHVGQAQSHQNQADQLDADGQHNILLDDAQALAGNPDGGGDLEGIVVHQYHIGGLDGGVGTHGTHGDADVGPAVLEIDYCRAGRVGWEMQGDISGYLGPGNLSIHGAVGCIDSAMEFPLGYLEGISVTVDLNCLDQEGSALLREAGVSGETLRRRRCCRQQEPASWYDPPFYDWVRQTKMDSAECANRIRAGWGFLVSKQAPV